MLRCGFVIYVVEGAESRRRQWLSRAVAWWSLRQAGSLLGVVLGALCSAPSRWRIPGTAGVTRSRSLPGATAPGGERRSPRYLGKQLRRGRRGLGALGRMGELRGIRLVRVSPGWLNGLCPTRWAAQPSAEEMRLSVYEGWACPDDPLPSSAGGAASRR